MKHHKHTSKLGRKTGQRQALMRTLAGSLFSRGKIKTTEAKAKALRPFAEKVITKAKQDSVANRRLVSEVLGSPKSLEKLFKDIGPRYTKRPGGYLRITKLALRAGDASKMAIIELV
ncbi:MAG: 50S ribosomal protein L17 [Candidatus Vogelbacteria bacterium CG22_combo_CG10-13_8_21_14_all_37_9]|uniref:Large ribosomal subunit protein bL17 n=1 Tax=Candidatus Vogelbacteria bacterium CG22_combo_CG10-13_8_21_14_all_37_9 TaxID=1975046 RepID=A0A2H0BKM7_9BACT|nr:MAG: 50S ribosomal protein L17 [bacterium CG10_37_50]PIP58233.1 MAG: 50S ribosomal protein L17 [Candidatus Vogelbacteria bacterium CG22_combo_CG10-13_8_21_14_all_37_9]